MKRKKYSLIRTNNVLLLRNDNKWRCGKQGKNIIEIILHNNNNKIITIKKIIEITIPGNNNNK